MTRLTFTAIWVAIAAGAWWILHRQYIPFPLAFGAAVAVWIEASLYAATGVPKVRDWFAKLPNKSFWLAVSALPAYLLYGLGVHWDVLAGLVITSFAVSYWFTLLPEDSDWTDIGFLLLVACGLLLKPFPRWFPPLAGNLKQAEFIGHLLWIRLAFWALLGIRKRSPAGFGFLPSARDWTIGLRQFLFSVPVFAVLLWILKTAQWKDHLSWTQTPLVLAGTFVGILWVVALSEDFLTQGILLPILTRWTSSEWAGLAITSVSFGLVHLSYRGFPNWRMVLLAGVLGGFLGRAMQLAGSVRACMVTHALAVAVYRTFFSER